MLELSLIIPAFNEAQRIGPTLRRAHRFLAARPASFEILVVDDGSTDDTVALVTALAGELPGLRVLRSPANRGKGHAVRRGMLAATGRIRVFSDADGSTPITELDQLLQALAAGADIALGSRYLAASQVTRPQPWQRRVWSRLVNRVVQRVLLPGVADTHCGFKAFTAAAAEQSFGACTVDGWSFDLEVLARARAQGLSLREVPVRWENDERSKARLRQLPREFGHVYRLRQQLRHAEKKAAARPWRWLGILNSYFGFARGAEPGSASATE
ncbi:dolichyl-phosphate beta-glucosyltransferase [Hymenobacter chitinivorans]|uniref:dolichyl-phosphate beta-glucosyltransferase n=1 Tax=Hymenobacter chitinivorans DSM 11115 TaxID=1121954 RepID=A0A2M9BSM1_9BACT|nr:dolichyl-phosphate beta-glucosyltransferase [Hymenobacter chitinivorans]PJJ60948.1 glycosyltransferase involved in cell wall biosynthesis [Hymenobacter chitinivorans DSM 11115]